jgi:uncharacterized protein (AIM24 family)
LAAEGFVMQRLDGDGWVFVQMGGTLVERELGPGEQLHVDTGCLAAYTPSVDSIWSPLAGCAACCLAVKACSLRD